LVIHRNIKYSRRQWDGLIKAWKLQIHSWNAKGDTDVFQKIDEWKNKEEDDPILGGPSKEKYSAKNEKVYRPFQETFKNEKESTKGLLISKYLFGVIILTKIACFICFQKFLYPSLQKFL
jgi:hypothetical protein